MFKDYKISIAFLVLVLIIIFGTAIQAQSGWWWKYGAGNKFYTYSILTDTAINITHEAALILGENDKTKSNKTDTLATKRAVQNFMVWWSDSTEQIVNGTFDSDTSGWVDYLSPTTLEWVANGGGFTGAVYIIGDQLIDGIKQVGTLQQGGSTRFQCDINIISMTATRLEVVLLTNYESYIIPITGTGLHQIDTVLRFTDTHNSTIGVRQGSAGSSEFYVDNFTFYPIIDSSQVLYKQLTNLVSETEYSYYHSAFVYTAAGDKSIDYYQGETKSFTTDAAPLSSINYMVTADGDTMFTADGDTMRIGFIQFDILEQLKNGENNEEDFILPQRVYAYLNSKRTMELNS